MNNDFEWQVSMWKAGRLPSSAMSAIACDAICAGSSAAALSDLASFRFTKATPTADCADLISAACSRMGIREPTLRQAQVRAVRFDAAGVRDLAPRCQELSRWELLSVDDLSEVAFATALARYYAYGITKGRIAPELGANRVWRLFVELTPMQQSEASDSLVHLAYSGDADLPDSASLNALIVSCAEALLSNGVGLD